MNIPRIPNYYHFVLLMYWHNISENAAPAIASKSLSYIVDSTSTAVGMILSKYRYSVLDAP